MEVVAALAVLLGSISQSVTGFGFGLTASPFLVAAYGAPAGVQISIVLSVAVNVLLLATGRRGLDGRAAARLLVPAAVATVVLGPMVRGRNTDHVTVAAGVLCLLGVGMVARRRAPRHLVGRTGTVLTGAVSGAMNVVAGISGPPVVLFGTTAGWSPATARPTLQAFFLGLNAVALATLGLPSHLPVAVCVAMTAGLLIGQPLVRRLHADHVRAAVLVIAAAGSLLAIGRGVF